MISDHIVYITLGNAKSKKEVAIFFKTRLFYGKKGRGMGRVEP